MDGPCPLVQHFRCEKARSRNDMISRRISLCDGSLLRKDPSGQITLQMAILTSTM